MLIAFPDILKYTNIEYTCLSSMSGFTENTVFMSTVQVYFVGAGNQNGYTVTSRGITFYELGLAILVSSIYKINLDSK